MEFDNIKEFAAYLGVQRGLSAATVREYRYDLRRYAAWLSDTGKRLSEVTPNDMDAYVLYLRGELNLQPRTCKRRIAAVSTYHKWLVRVGVLQNDPVYFIVLPKAGTNLPIYLTKDEIGQFMLLIEEEAVKRPIVGTRNRAMFYLMMFAGLRISETLAIRESTIAMQDGLPDTVTVVGKGNKERQVPLSEKAAMAVRSWMDTKKALREDDDLARKLTRKNLKEIMSDLLFPGRDGRQMDKRAVQRKIASLRGEFGNKKLTPHKLRHTFGTSLNRAGVDIKTIQELLGHKDIGTTQIYTHVEASQKKAAVKLL